MADFLTDLLSQLFGGQSAGQPQPQPQPRRQLMDDGLGTPQAGPQAIPPIAPRYEPGFKDRLYASGQILTGGEPSAMDRTNGARNLTAQVLKSRGASDQEIQAAIANPEIMKQVLANAFSSKTITTKAGDIVSAPDGKGAWKTVIDNSDRSKPTLVGPGVAAIAPGEREPFYTAPKPPPDLSATDKKAIFDAENELPAMNDTLGKLKRAKELNSKVYTGLAPKFRGQMGAMTPYPTTEDKATVEWHKMMEPAAIKEMSETLKGASTDREMFKYLELIADASTPVDVRERLIDKAIALAEHSQRIGTDRINQIRGRTYYGKDGGQSAPGEVSRAPAGSMPNVRTFNPKTGRLE